MKAVKQEDVLNTLKDTLKDNFIDGRIKDSSPAGKNRVMLRNVWMKIKKESIRQAVKKLAELQEYPHISVISNDDIGDNIILNYHLTMNYAIRHREFIITIKTEIPKSDMHIDTITDIIPGAELTEREKQEMLGIIVDGIPDGRRAFMPRTYPEGYYPLRKDKENVEKLSSMVRELYVEDRAHLPWKKEAKK